MFPINPILWILPLERLMIQTDYPNVVVILPLKNNRSDVKWSNDIDNQIANVFGSKTALLYGSRDSFIPSHIVVNIKLLN